MQKDFLLFNFLEESISSATESGSGTDHGGHIDCFHNSSLVCVKVKP